MSNEMGDVKVKKQKTANSVHLLLVGHSTGHILKVIEKFNPIHMELFTSVELKDEVAEFVITMSDFEGTYNIQLIPSFTKESLITGIYIISCRYSELKRKFPGAKIYFGITGGTNPMAVEMAIAAIFSEESIHYVVKGKYSVKEQNEIFIYDTAELKKFITNGNVRGGVE
ncbi:hypothetical protein ACNF40_01100 [Cuniculiplasma sp. SKW4]|uniref:hypothetical protein n=1 Tax=Cuniculiplasma sp. SKW4 TaxID=3400171 RepID=UPI003FD377C5